MYVYEIRRTDNGETLEAYETGAEAGERAKVLNDELRASGAEYRVRVKRVEQQGGPMVYVFVDDPSRVLSPDLYQPYHEAFHAIPADGLDWRRAMHAAHGLTWEARKQTFLAEEWFRRSPLSVLHYPHPDPDDRRKVRFVPDEQAGREGRFRTMHPGRYLRRYFGSELTEADIERYAIAWTELFEPLPLRFAHTPEEIVWVYENGPRSCMSHDRCDYNSSVHPTYVYGAGDLAIAYQVNKRGRVSARVLVWPERKIYGQIYGDYWRIEAALKDAGYTVADETGPRSFEGARLLRIEDRPGVFVAPYVDEPAPNRARDEGDYLVLDWDGDVFCTETGGLACALTCAYCGGRVDQDMALYVSEDGPLCEDCYDENYFTCEGCWEAYHVDSGRIGPDDDYWCEDCFADRFAECGNCAEVINRDDLREAPDRRNDLCPDCFDELVTACAGCGDAIMQEDAVIVDGDDYCDDCAPAAAGCTCHLRQAQARAEAEAASDPFRGHYVADDGGPDGYTVAEKENQERIDAAVAAVDPCDWCREQEGQLTFELAAY